MNGFRYSGASIRAFSPLFARIQVLSLHLGGNGSHFLGAPLAPGKWLSVAAPLRIEGLRCLVTIHTMAGAPRIARRLPCNHKHCRTYSASCPAPTGHLYPWRRFWLWTEQVPMTNGARTHISWCRHPTLVAQASFYPWSLRRVSVIYAF